MRPIPARPGLRALDVAVAVGLLLALGALALTLRAPEVAGAMRVVDGDTLEQDRRRIRLTGLDAPEMGQVCERPAGSYRCGAEARAALRDILGDRPATCRLSGLDRYGRDLGRCRTESGDVGAELVRRGWAVSEGAYAAEEAGARARGAGLWAGPFERPSAWRHRQPGYRAP